MSTKRKQIVTALVDLFKAIDGTSPYLSNLYENVKGQLIFWDEVNDFPTVCVNSSDETREYLPSGFKWGFLTINIRIYVKEEDAKGKLEDIFCDIETVLDANNTLTLDGSGDTCTDIRIISISDDEGLLNPLGVGEVILEIQYSI